MKERNKENITGKRKASAAGLPILLIAVLMQLGQPMPILAAENCSGLEEEAYSYDEGQTWTVDSTFTVEKNGVYSIWVRDKAGNIAKESIQINTIDRQAPILHWQVDKGSREKRQMVLELRGEDDLSGFPEAPYSYDGGKTWTWETKRSVAGGKRIRVQVRDNAGNLTSLTVSTSRPNSGIAQGEEPETGDGTETDEDRTLEEEQIPSEDEEIPSEDEGMPSFEGAEEAEGEGSEEEDIEEEGIGEEDAEETRKKTLRTESEEDLTNSEEQQNAGREEDFAGYKREATKEEVLPELPITDETENVLQTSEEGGIDEGENGAHAKSAIGAVLDNLGGTLRSLGRRLQDFAQTPQGRTVLSISAVAAFMSLFGSMGWILLGCVKVYGYDPEKSFRFLGSVRLLQREDCCEVTLPPSIVQKAVTWKYRLILPALYVRRSRGRNLELMTADGRYRGRQTVDSVVDVEMSREQQHMSNR